MMKNLFNLRSMFFLLYFTMISMTINAQSFGWAKSIGGPGRDEGRNTAVDKAGNVYFVGRFSFSAIFDSSSSVKGTLTGAGGFDAFLIKYDAQGNCLWGKSMGGRGNDEATGVAVDEKGNVYITGSFSDTANFDSGAGAANLISVGGLDLFFAKYDSSGNCIWAKDVGSSAGEVGMGIDVDEMGNVYITGSFSGTASGPAADFDPGPGTAILSRLGNIDIFIAKYDSNGGYLWAKNAGGPSSGAVTNRVSVDKDGNAFITGSCSGTTDFGSGITVSGALYSSYGFLAKYDSSGGCMWAFSMGALYTYTVGQAVVANEAGDVYLAGKFMGAVDFDPGVDTATLTSVNNSYDAFLAKYDAEGNYLWAKRMGDRSSQEGQGLAVDRVGNVYVTGVFMGQLDLEEDTLQSIGGSTNTFIAKYNEQGNYIWGLSIGDSAAGGSADIALDESANVYAVGSFFRSGDFDPGSGVTILTAVGENDVHMFKLVCKDTSSSYLKDSARCGLSYTLNGEVYSTSGTYTQVFPNAAGCDSTLTFDLIFYPIAAPELNVNEFVLGVIGTYATYQWVKDGTPIIGATGSTYTVTENGDYQVIVTDEAGCSASSDVYTVDNVSIQPVAAIAQQISVYPNPADDVVHIQSSVKVNVTLTDIQGRTIQEVRDARTLSFKDLAPGIYLLRITDTEGNLIKVVKEVKQAR